MIKLGYIDSLCNCISDFENIMNRKGFILVEEPILDDKEKEYIRNVIKPFRHIVKYIRKQGSCSNSDKEFIVICLNGRNTPISFPYFGQGTMYKNMKLGKNYTLKELGL